MMFVIVIIFITVASFFALYINNHIDDADKKERERKKNEERVCRERKEAEERELKERKETEDRERQFHEKMINIVQILNNQVVSVKDLYKKILNTIPVADKALHIAEEEFNGGFYAPFWDQIEAATNQLASYNNYLHGINSCMDTYWIYIRDLDESYNNQVKLCVLPGKLPDPIISANRLTKLVRMAQRNFEFSTIYEQRKTNKLLYEGFRNLGDAIYSLGDRITDSLNDLSRNLDSSLSDIISAINENSRIIGDNIQEQTSRLDGHAEQQRRYESDSLRNQSEQQKTLEQQKRVLDSQNRRINNIQRGRKPGLFDE